MEGEVQTKIKCLVWTKAALKVLMFLNKTSFLASSNFQNLKTDSYRVSSNIP